MSVSSRNTGRRYIPILKTKSGELSALKQLGQQQRNAITPLLELHKTDPLKDMAFLQKYSTKLGEAWPGGEKIYIDGVYVSNFANNKLVPSPCVAFFNAILAAGISVIPVTDPYRSVNYQTAICNVANSSGDGICIRIQSSFLINNREQFYIDINNFLNNCGLNISTIDLLFDLGDISPSLQMASSIFISGLVAEMNNLCAIGSWREVILAGTSFPAILQGNTQTLFAINRIEWNIWDQLRQEAGLQRIPNFADYTCLPAVHLAPAPYMAPAPKIRYTTDSRWLIAKGQSVKNSSSAQYYTLARSIVGLPDFCGAGFSYGDNYIEKRSTQIPPSTGYFTQWLTADINHHISYVIAQI